MFWSVNKFQFNMFVPLLTSDVSHVPCHAMPRLPLQYPDSQFELTPSRILFLVLPLYRVTWNSVYLFVVVGEKLEKRTASATPPLSVRTELPAPFPVTDVTVGDPETNTECLPLPDASTHCFRAESASWKLSATYRYAGVPIEAGNASSGSVVYRIIAMPEPPAPPEVCIPPATPAPPPPPVFAVPSHPAVWAEPERLPAEPPPPEPPAVPALLHAAVDEETELLYGPPAPPPP